MALVMWSFGCQKEETVHHVRGAELLASDVAGDETAYDIIAYPATQDEMRYFVDNVDQFVRIAMRDGRAWNQTQFARRPMKAVREHPVWRETGLQAEDFMAAFAKLDFLQGYAEDPISPEELLDGVARMRRTLREEGGDSELRKAIEVQSKLARAAAAHGPEAIALYRDNKAAIDRALDRFRSIGE